MFSLAPQGYIAEVEIQAAISDLAGSIIHESNACNFPKYQKRCPQPETIGDYQVKYCMTGRLRYNTRASKDWSSKQVTLYITSDRLPNDADVLLGQDAAPLSRRSTGSTIAPIEQASRMSEGKSASMFAFPPAVNLNHMSLLLTVLIRVRFRLQPCAKL